MEISASVRPALGSKLSIIDRSSSSSSALTTDPAIMSAHSHHPRSSRWFRILHLLTAISLTGLSLTSCAKYAQIKEVRPSLMTTPATTVTTAAAERITTLQRARQRENRAPAEAVGLYLTVLHSASIELTRTPSDRLALEHYNFALARVFDVLSDQSSTSWRTPMSFPAVGGEWQLSTERDPRAEWNPDLYTFRPVDTLSFTGKYVVDRSVKPGLGAPLVVASRATNFLEIDRFAQGQRVFYGATAVARFTGRRCVITFDDPLAHENVMWSGHRFPLAADFTAPLAMALVLGNPKSLELARLLNPEKYAQTARLARLQPYDPKKIPIICIHGLKDSHATWVPLINALRDDPEIRQRYQIWFYTYPSGYPYPYSAALLRRQMDEIKKQHPGHKEAVLIGHSMGGVISRSLITDSGDTLWKTFFNAPPEAVRANDESMQVAREFLIFRHREDVGRVIFIAAPHRGSKLASHWIGRLGSRLVRTPSSLLAIGQQMRHLITLDSSLLKTGRIPNSVDTLSPDNPFVRAINTLPITPTIPYHSIIGDRGKGDTPHSSDGIVPYWSSHLDGAQSELIVPSGHSAHQNPQAIKEVRRILNRY